MPDIAKTGDSSPVYRLNCRTPEGETVTLSYSPHTSELVDEEGRALLADAQPVSFPSVERVSPSHPGRKSRAPTNLKIQLGMRCNYSCSYCNQSSAVADSVVTRTADSLEFLENLDQWLEGAPERIEFWGGEPFLYFAKLKVLVPAIRERFPQASLEVITNGSLLDSEILDFIETWDLYVTVSHDGPGQHLRGPDPFADPVRASWLRELWLRRGGPYNRMSFNVVLTPANADVVATRAWLADRIGDERVVLRTEGAVSVYDERTRVGAGQWQAADFELLASSVIEGFESGAALQFHEIREKAQDFIGSLRDLRPSSALGQKCGMDQMDHLAVDLHGNVMTCQNTGASGRHALGNASQMENVRLTSATHWSFRRECNHCPVLQLCKGGCMFLQDNLFAQSCENEYHYNLAIMAATLRKVTGLQLESVDGDIQRPTARRMIAITPA